MMAARRAFTLLEMLLALPLVTLLAIVTVHLLLSVHRQVLGSDALVLTTRELRQGANVLAAEWRTLHPADVVAWTDTSVEFHGTVAVGTICSSLTPRRTVAILANDASATQGNNALATQLNQSIQAGDLLHVWLPGRTPLDALRDTVVRVASVANGAECARSVLGTAAGVSALRITLADSLTAVPAFGTPVRMTRRTKYSLYRSSDGQWFLGRRTLGMNGWDVIQPVSGPLRAPRDSGLVFSIWNPQGNRVPGTGGTSASLTRNAMSDSLLPTRLRMHMRALRVAGNATPLQPTIDSLTLDVTIRSFTGIRP